MAKVVQLKLKARSVCFLTYKKQFKQLKGIFLPHAPCVLHICCESTASSLSPHSETQAEEAAPAQDIALLRYCPLREEKKEQYGKTLRGLLDSLGCDMHHFCSHFNGQSKSATELDIHVARRY